MPLFDYKCPSCNAVIEQFVRSIDDDVRCSSCGSSMSRLFSPGGIAVHCWPAEGVHLKHVSPEGKTFHSKKEMRKYANDNDLELGALL